MEKQKATGFLNVKKQPMRIYEIISVFYKCQPNYFPQGLVKCKVNNFRPAKLCKNSLYNGEKVFKESEYINYPKNIIDIPYKIGKRYHNTQKPTEILEYLIKTYTNEQDFVLDNCMCSGSTEVACVNTNRNFIGIELEENYFEIAKNRIKKAKEALKPVDLFEL